MIRKTITQLQADDIWNLFIFNSFEWIMDSYGPLHKAVQKQDE